MKCVALVPAAGQGKRMGGAHSKPYLLLEGKPILAHTLLELERCPLVDEVVLMVERGEIERARASVVEEFRLQKVGAILAGGVQRQDSVWEGLKTIQDDCDLVMVHDGVRPFISQEMLARSIQGAVDCGASIAGMPAKDTVKLVSAQNMVLKTPDRKSVFLVQTPQTFKRDILLRAYRQAMEDGFYATDEASLVERLGMPVKVVEGSYENIKITTPEDLVVGEMILKRKTCRMHDAGPTP
jgi:2-C-methyl-D-erythritol 4-phosphate cytidylyltransferase